MNAKRGCNRGRCLAGCIIVFVFFTGCNVPGQESSYASFTATPAFGTITALSIADETPTSPPIMRIHTEPELDAPQTFQEVAHRSQTIVLADVLSVDQGPDFVASIVEQNEMVQRTPSQRIEVQVVKVYKGNVAEQQTITLFQNDTGIVEVKPAPGEVPTSVLMVNDNDPPYMLGQRYLLALELAQVEEQIKQVQPEPWQEGMFFVRFSAGRLLVNSIGSLTRVVANDNGGSSPGDMLSETLSEMEVSLAQ